MKRTFTQLTLIVIAVIGFSVSSFAQFSDLIISEYAEGSSNHKYIEIYNGTGDSVNLANYQLRRISNGGLWTENSYSLSGWLHDGDVMVAANSSADTAILNLPSATTAYNAATYFNGNDAVGLAKDTGSGNFIVIDAVGTWGAASYWSVAGVSSGTSNHTLIRKACVTGPDTNWTTLTAGTNMYNSQWIVLAQNSWDNAGTHDTVCTPTYPISAINTTDMNGVADSIGVNCWTKGVVLGVDMDGNNGISFTIYDGVEGIGIYNSSDVGDFVVNEGDSILIRGTVGQYNGLTQLGSIDYIHVLSTGNTIPTPAVVTTFVEADESTLIKIENVEVTAISGINFTLSDGTTNFTMRVDYDTDVLDSLTIVVGDSLCSVTGILGQYDSSNPYTSGYQLFPRRYTDVDTACGVIVITPGTPTYAISTINTTDMNGVADSLGVYCWAKGIVLGVDMDGNAGLSFTIYDGADGMGIYNSSDVSGYVVTEGDSILIRGTVGQYNGLTQLGSIDSIQLVNTGNTIPTAVIVTSLTESMESSLVTFENAYVYGMSGSNFYLVSGIDSIAMRIDSDTDVLDSLSILIGDSLCSVTGIVGQYDNSNPYTSGYQLFPRTYVDVDTTCGGSVTPPATPTYAINVVNTTDTDGVADSNGVYCWVKGVVLGVNMNGNGLSFTMYDNGGIGVYNNSGNLGYTVTEGDSIMLRGSVGQYRGLTQLSPDSITFINAGNTIPAAVVVTTLDETTESSLVTFENAYVSDISGSNYTLVSGMDTIMMRIDSDTDVLDSLSIIIGDSLCSVTGIGGQYDFSSPYTSGYQLFPRSYMDVDTACGGTVTPPMTPTYAINVVNTTDTDGVADSTGVYCWVKGVVLGVNMNGFGLSFTMYDNGGIGVYNNSGDLGYTVTEGDSIMLRGTVGQYRGLTQLSPDSITFINAGNTIPAAVVVTTLDESTESTLVTFKDAMLVDTNGINFTFAAGLDTIMVRIDPDTDVLDSFNLQIGDSICAITGIGGQYDFSSPYTSGYQLFPRRSTDLDTTCTISSVINVNEANSLVVYPNPVSNENGLVHFNKTITFNVYSITGQLVATRNNVDFLSVSKLDNGIYIIKTSDGEVVRMIVK